ncbi:serine hydrolase domain-containing protein [Streptomyces sp. NPDC050617]|uniref:serine hydrolase domain-containing protein n=1 Tax=Streptomyces sp. NPDC050617 TaxID=3154628 RepID=UPI0034219994
MAGTDFQGAPATDSPDDPRTDRVMTPMDADGLPGTPLPSTPPPDATLPDATPPGATPPGATPPGPQPPSALLSAAPGASAVVAGLYHRGQRTFIARGSTEYEGGDPADARTRFEIGSLTKTFTALLLAELAARGEVGHHDSAVRHLPPGTRYPAGAEAITLTHLATHTSGLPRLPPGLLATAGRRLFANPYAAFTGADVLHALSRTRLRFRPGSRLRYSNFGVGLLGHALCGAAGGGLSYEELLASRVLSPLGLSGTSCVPRAGGGDPEATGYRRRRPRPPFAIPGMPAAGAARADARDLLAYAEALTHGAEGGGAGTSTKPPGPPSAPLPGPLPAPLRTALQDVTRPRLTMPRGRDGLALVWNVRPLPDGSALYHHSGGTLGCTSFAGFSPRHDVALVALANCAPEHGNTLIQEAYDALARLIHTA